jgi:Family of unknown function (DUF5706)
LHLLPLFIRLWQVIKAAIGQERGVFALMNTAACRARLNMSLFHPVQGDKSHMNDETIWPDEAIQLIRTTQQHHVQLSMMADQKANMLIGATFVVFTLAIGQNDKADVSLPLLVLATFSFLSAAFAALAVMPFTSNQVPNEPNWLFFGAFSKLSENEFTENVLSRIGQQETIYRTMLHDIYQLGNVLETKKYRYLRIAYRLFLVGITLTFALFVFEKALGSAG